jgi:hypothetical protein
VETASGALRPCPTDEGIDDMAIMSVAAFERFFRIAASLDIDKEDLRRYNEFVNHKTYDLLLRGQATAKANARPHIAPCDLPITKGLQECMHEFRKIDADIALQPILDEITKRPILDLPMNTETEARLPMIVGGLSVALAKSFHILEPDLKNPQTQHWERAFRLFDLVL